MGAAKGIVHIQVTQPREFARKGGVVLFFFGRKAHIFQQHHLSRFQRFRLLYHIVANHIVSHLHGAAEQLLQTRGDGLERIFFLRSLGATEV